MISLKLSNIFSKTVLFVILSFFISFQSGAIQFVGNYSTHFVQDNTIYFFCGATVVNIQVCTADIIKVRLDLTGNLQPDTSLVVIHETWPTVNFTVTDVGQTINIQTAQIIVKCLKHPFRMAFYDKAEQLIVKEPVLGGGLAWENQYRYAFFDQTVNDHFYGLGERSIPLDRKGFEFEMRA